VVIADLALAPLAKNGGPTKTYALPIGSRDDGAPQDDRSFALHRPRFIR
jgi:hypothetical protein